MIWFFLNFEPNPPKTTHQQKKVAVVKGKPIMYEGEALKKARYDIMAKIEKFKPDKPLDVPVRLKVVWVFTGKEGWRVQRPDTDNLDKLLKDCLTAQKFWRDDSYVVDEKSYKINLPKEYRHGILVKIEEEEPWISINSLEKLTEMDLSFMLANQE